MNSKNYKSYRKNLTDKTIAQTQNISLLTRALERHSIDTLPTPKDNMRICPDCGKTLHYNSYHKKFSHSPFLNCYYEENVYGQCLYNNEQREKDLEKNKNLN